MYQRCVWLCIDAFFFCSVRARINCSQDGFDALMFAAQEGRLEVVEWLLDAKANVAHRSDKVFCALFA